VSVYPILDDQGQQRSNTRRDKEEMDAVDVSWGDAWMTFRSLVLALLLWHKKGARTTPSPKNPRSRPDSKRQAMAIEIRRLISRQEGKQVPPLIRGRQEKRREIGDQERKKGDQRLIREVNQEVVLTIVDDCSCSVGFVPGCWYGVKLLVYVGIHTHKRTRKDVRKGTSALVPGVTEEGLLGHLYRNPSAKNGIQ
jgi:hypothetical protein